MIVKTNYYHTDDLNVKNKANNLYTSNDYRVFFSKFGTKSKF